MAILIIDQHGSRHAGILSGRVLIGRWPENTVVIDDRTVSRIHAWVGVQGGHYYVADTGSRTGTIVNGHALRERHVLSDGDEIRIGPAILYYYGDEALPGETAEIDLTPRGAEELSGVHGEFIDCICGAPLWMPHGFTGRGQCRYCGHTLTRGGVPPEPGPPPVPPEIPAEIPAESEREAIATPAPPPTAAAADDDDDDDTADDDFNAVIEQEFARPNPKVKALPPAGRRVPPPAPISRPPLQTPGAPAIAQPGLKRLGPAEQPPLPPAIPAPPPQQSKAAETARPAKETACGVCHSPITIFDDVTQCPSCGLMFHTECWTENRGCSSYGCAQVGVLERE